MTEPKQEGVSGGIQSMVERASPHRQSCVTAHHKGHLCQLADRYFHIREPERFREMVTDPRYTCEFCGRTAREAHNLCYPIPL